MDLLIYECHFEFALDHSNNTKLLGLEYNHIQFFFFFFVGGCGGGGGVESSLSAGVQLHHDGMSM